MKSSGGSEAMKRRAGESAAETVTDGDVVGLGTGSTAAHAIRALGERVADGLSITGVATSFASRELALDAGISLVDLAAVTEPDADGIDVAIDGADCVAGGDLIKGGGAAHAREKLVDAAADRFVVVADATKCTDVLAHPVPIEVLPSGRGVVATSVAAAGGEAAVRRAERKDGPVVTDNGNLVLDCAFGPIEAPATLAQTLAETPGVVEHGLFVGLADEIHLGTRSGVDITRVTKR